MPGTLYVWVVVNDVGGELTVLWVPSPKVIVHLVAFALNEPENVTLPPTVIVVGVVAL